MLADPASHDLSHSSEPTGAEPSFQPIATAPAKTADEALSILADEVIDFAQRDQAAHERLADLERGDADYPGLSAEASRLEDQVKGRLTMAALVRADTPAGLAAKGRAAIAFRKTLEGCVIDEATPLLLSMAEDAVRLAGQAPDQLWAGQDAAVIHAAAEVRRTSEAHDAMSGADPELDDDHPEQIAWAAKNDEAYDRFRNAVAHLATLQPVTPVGMAAKAAAAPSLTSFWDFVNNSWHEADLMQSIAADAQRIGSALAGSAIGPDAAGRAIPTNGEMGDAALIRRAREVVTLVQQLRIVDAQHQELYARYRAEVPEEPESVDAKAREAYMAVLDAYHADQTPKDEHRAREALRCAAQAKQAILDTFAAEMKHWEQENEALEMAIGIDACQEEQDCLYRMALRGAWGLTLMTPTTLAGLIAKAEASIEITRSALENEAEARDLAAMVVRETLLIPTLAPVMPQEAPASADRMAA